MASTSTLISMLRQIMKRQALVCAVIVVIGLVVGGLTTGTTGLWGAALGGVVAVIFVGTTGLSMLAAVGREPHMVMLLVLGLWIVKMVVVVAILVGVRGMDFYDKYTLFGVLVGVVLASLAIDIHGVMTARLTNVEVPEHPTAEILD